MDTRLSPSVLAKSPNIKCANCPGTIFMAHITLKRVSGLVSPTGSEEIVPIDVHTCVYCGTPNIPGASVEQTRMILGTADEKEKEE